MLLSALQTNSLTRRMMIATAMVATIGLSTVSQAKQAADAPSAEQVIDAYVKAIGGAEKLNSFKNRRTTATLSMPQVGLNGPMKITQAAPKNYRMEVNLQGIGQILQISDGQQVLDKNPLTGSRILEGAEKDAVMLEANFYSDSQWRDIYEKVTYAGKEDIGGRPNHKIVLETAAGNKRTHFYDVETNLLTAVQATVSTVQGDLSTETRFADYREVDGIKFPHKTTIAVMGQTQVVQIEKIENDVELPADTFKIPDA
jgi:outer membrane lipoprotein-sorting protein